MRTHVWTIESWWEEGGDIHGVAATIEAAVKFIGTLNRRTVRVTNPVKVDDGEYRVYAYHELSDPPFGRIDTLRSKYELHKRELLR